MHSSTLRIRAARPLTAPILLRIPGSGPVRAYARLTPLALALGLAGLAAGPAAAEVLPAAFQLADNDTPAAPAAEATAGVHHGLETVVVTSQKRREDIRKVPMSVTALSGEALANEQVLNVTDLTRNVPNVSFSAQGGAGVGLGNIEIRGVSSQAGSATVGVYLDDVSLTTRNLYSQGTAEPRFFDIDRVEVLRGPQGTLYGAGSMGGTIRFISNTPDLKHYSADVRADLTTTDHGGSNSLLQGVVNVPVSTGVAAVRIGVQTGHDSGYIDQVSPATLQPVATGINGVDWKVLKLSGKVLAGDWSFTPALFYQRTSTADIDATYLAVGPNQTANPNAALSLFQTSKIVREPGEDTLALPSLTVNGDLGFADLTAVANAYRRHFARTQDGTYVNSVYVGSAAGTTVISNTAVANVVQFLPSAVYLDNKIDQTGLEVRLTSKAREISQRPYTWVAGVFSSQTKTDVTDNEPIFGINQAFTNAGVSINDPAQWDPNSGIFPNAFPNDNSYFSNRHYKDQQDSIFGELTWYASDRLRLIAGLRYLRATEDFHREGGDFFAGQPFTTTSISTSASRATPRFAINFDCDAQTTVYASAAEGFRLGGANRPIPLTIQGVSANLAALGLASAPDSFKPDSLWSYEIGSKSRFLDNRVSLNLAAFYVDWRNIQQDIYLPAAGFDFETNVGKATSSGFEMELRARVTDDLTLSASGGLVRAVFAEDVPSLGADAAGNLHVHKGDPIQGVPRYNLRAGGEYHFHVVEHDSVVRLNVQGTGSSHGSIVPGDPDYSRPSYVTADASWGVSFGSWELALIAKNLGNDHTVLQHPIIQSVNQAYYLRPRTYGLSLTGAL